MRNLEICAAVMGVVLGLGSVGLGQMAPPATPPATSPAAVPATMPSTRAEPGPSGPAVLPGKGMAEHDFFYAGEAKDRRAYIVKEGKVVWTYDDPEGKGEISDAVLMSNGNVLLAHQFGIKLVSAENKVLWSLEAPKGTEIHTAVPIGKEHILYVQNGAPAVVKIVNFVTGETKKSFEVPVKNPERVHGHFRHARITPWGTLAVAHLDMGVVAEYDGDGKVLRKIEWPGLWGVTPLASGNLLLAGRGGVKEVDKEGKDVWTLSAGDIPEYKMGSIQIATRLANGNTLLNNWANQWNGPIAMKNPPMQAIEVTPEKKVVWGLRQWAEPNLGPATIIQVIDGGVVDPIENVKFGGVE